MTLLYKYRGIKEFRYFTDIILNSRLYAAPYNDLNDPMEGHYLYHSGELDSDVRDLISTQKSKLRICSLSKDPDNELMWAHYAEGHRGVVVGVTVKDAYETVPIIYDGPAQIGRINIHNSTAQEVLSHKLEVWNYEDEVRVFVHGKQYVHVKVREIILGQSMATQDVGFIRSLVEKIDPRIEVKHRDGA